MALVECFLLLTFTSYSWIETSSSLIISTGNNYGMEYSMAVAHNLSYQVLVSPDAGGAVKLASKNTHGEADDDGFYRKVQNFCFAKTSSPDGKTFYFKKNDGTGGYRVGDTTDINTTYTYLDFEIKNTTATAKEFCFRNTNRLFEYTGHLSGDDATLDTTYEDTILDAMRISFEVVSGDSGNPSDPLIVSRNPATYTPINSTTPTTSTITYDDSSTTAVRYHSLEHHEYNEPTQLEPEPEQYPLFVSDASGSGEATDRIAVRIWFDERDAVYSALSSEAKANCDKALHAAEISVNFLLVSDTIDYDAIYFDDYAFSNKVGCEGKFVTDEMDGYSVYLHAFSSKETGDGFKNFKMTKVKTDETPANRWVVSIPLGNVVDGSGEGLNYLTSNTSTPPTKWNNTYFYYGNAAGTEKLYQWDFNTLPSGKYLEIVDADDDSGYEKKLSDRCSYFRNLGVVRNSENYNNSGLTVEGFLQYDRYNGEDPMQLTYLRDEATALTGASYNNSVENGALNYRYISDQAQKQYNVFHTETTTGEGDTIIMDYSSLDNYSSIKGRIYYADVDIGCKVMFRDNTQSSPEQQTNDMTAENGKTYWVGNVLNDQQQVLQINNGSYGGYSFSNLPSLPNDAGKYRVYFFKSESLDSKWPSNGVIVKQTSGGQGNNDDIWMNTLYGDTSFYKPGTGTVTTEVVDYQRYKGGLYLNLRNGENYETDERKTISTYYDSQAGLFMVYVPHSWAWDNNSTGFDIHYNELDGYYDCAADKLRWASGVAGESDTFTLLGYSDANTVAELNDSGVPVGSGVGTWDSVRRIEFTTELLYSGTGATLVYKTGTSASLYPMIPEADDDLYFKFYAFVPESGLSSQTTNHNLRYARYNDYTDNNGTGIWYPQENVTSADMTYYAIDSTAAANNAQSENRGWFHVAVFVDGTFENIVYDTLYGTGAANGALLRYAEEDNTTSTLTYHPVVTTTVTTSGGETHVNAALGTNITKIGNSRWVVPVSSTAEYVNFLWTPYPDTNTEFDYTVDLSKGIYCIVTEAN